MTVRTIGRHHRGPPGSYPAKCDYCGVKWPRHKLRRDGAGFLACPDEGSGRDHVMLAKAQARASAALRNARPPRFTGGFAAGAPVPTYDNPAFRFGDRLLGWYQYTEDHTTRLGQIVTTVHDRGPRGNAIDMPTPFSGTVPTLVADTELGVSVLSIVSLFTTGSTGLQGFVGTQPVSVFVTIKMPASAPVDGTVLGIGFGDEYSQSELRRSGPNTTVRFLRRSPLELSTETEALSLTPNAWNVIGMVWLDTGVCQVIVNDEVIAEVTSPTIDSAPLAGRNLNLPILGYNVEGFYLAEAAAVHGPITELEARAQVRYMMQYANMAVTP